MAGLGRTPPSGRPHPQRGRRRPVEPRRYAAGAGRASWHLGGPH